MSVKNRKLRIVAGSLAMVMAISSLMGCSAKKETVSVDIKPMEAEEIYSYSFDMIGGSDVMPLTGYFGPCLPMQSYGGNNQPSSLTDEWYQAVVDCGINVLTYPQIDYKSAPEATMKMLDLAEKYNIAQLVFDSELMASYEATKEEVVEMMSEYLTHPAFAGFFLYDEPGNAITVPSRTHLSQLANLSNILNNDLNMYVYCNLLGGGTPSDTYVAYLKEYCETHGQTHISFDYYPEFNPETAKTNSYEDYFSNLAIIRQIANEYKMPFWSYVAAGSQWNDARDYIETKGYYPEEGQFDWNVNTSLAFGAKGINYFILNQPYWFAYGPEEGVYDFERNGLFGAYGNKTRWYYYTQDINKQIVAIDDVLMNSVNKGVIATGKAYSAMKNINEDNNLDRSVIIEEGAWRELANVSGDAIVGCFNYLGKTALYVVNYDFDYAQKIDLSFVKECNVKVIQNAKTTYVKGESMTLDMPAGDGVLLVFE